MALWTERDWKVKNEADLNGYIYAVSVVAGFICADIFRFYYDSKSDYRLLEIFFRGQQGINIFLDREKDLKRGVSFWPPGWT
jgi:farnesyl-diphosphate farnesyltransferase